MRSPICDTESPTPASFEKTCPAPMPQEGLALHERLQEVLARAQPPAEIVSVALVDSGLSPSVLTKWWCGAQWLLSPTDFAEPLGTWLAVVLPGIKERTAEDTLQDLLARLTPLAPHARAGIAVAPQDGMSGQHLLAAARAAARVARPGEVLVSSPRLYQLNLGERSPVVADDAMVSTYELLKRLAASPLPVLLHGETGSGKEHAAWALHHSSPRATRPFVALNCAALPESLAESELFGHERGAFSGAERAREGILERAHGGTLFLDEVAELSAAMQAKLLRALDQKRITRLGDSRERQVDVRLVAASHRRLSAEVQAGHFREDLFFRLSAAVVHLPPLRQRPLEILLLARAFLEQACAKLGRPPLVLSPSAVRSLSAYPWPGNVRELKNAMDFLAATVPGAVAEPSHLPPLLLAADAPPQAVPPISAQMFRPLAEELRSLERQRMMEAMDAANGVQTRAAQLLGMPLRTFVLKVKKYQLAPSKASKR